MTNNEILLDFINDFKPAKVNPLFRELSRGTLRPYEEHLPQYTSAPFSDGYWHGAMQLTDENELIVCSFMIHKELSERSGKKEQYNLAKKILKDFQRYTGGFFIFYDTKGDFRFSLIYDIPGPDGKRYGNNFRRYTYFVSKEQTNKTFRTRLSEADFSYFENIRDAFSVEKVTKAFYAELQNWHFWAMNIVEFPDDEDKDKNSRNAKNLIRLITRIIFIWFMKEKRLIPSSLFEKQFIDNLLNYNDKTGSTYYKAILQNLFFATLNTKMRKDESHSRIFVEDAQKNGYTSDAYLQQGYYRYSRFIKDKEQFLKEFENIPFLNGGLFECLDKKIDGKEIRIDCFSDNPKNETRLKVPDEIFFSEEEVDADLSAFLENNNRRKVRGLIPILKSYNFTTDENTPIDEEVALDPELLGKVFENLLASYNPETAVTARKATGSYYTPREIVEYMVTESLVMHLAGTLGDEPATIEKLKKLFSYSDDSNPFDAEETESIISSIEKIRILDPACGSGAFPMGILHKLVLALHKLDPQNTKWKKRLIEGVPPELQAEVEQSLQNKSLDYIRKLGLIEHCIFGVDIQEIAIQISKLRFFISLLIEQEIDDSKENRDIRALPNLETKFVAANTLIGLDADLPLKSDEIMKLEEEIFNVRERIFYTNSRSEKYKLQRKLTDIRNQLKTELAKVGFPNDKAEKITQWDPFDQNTHADWFDPEWMFGIKTGFDIVIGNPPYVSTKGVSENDKKILEKQFGFADDLYNHFYFKGMYLLNEKGILTFISSKTFWTIQTKKNLRELILRNQLLQLFDTANPFDTPMVDTCVILIQKCSNPPENYLFKYLDGTKSIINPEVYISNIEYYKNAPNQVFFSINDYNIKVYECYGKKVNKLLSHWWDKISTSKNIEKNKTRLEEYRKSLKPGDVTLLGLITEGGQGLATANNGKYIGVKKGTKWAENVKKQRPEKLLLATEFCHENHITNKIDAIQFLNDLSETGIRNLFDRLKEKYGRDIFGQGWLYRIVSDDEIADVDLLTDNEKLNGIIGDKTFVPYDKGDKDGNRWYAPTPYYIDWSRENVKFLKENSGKKGEGMPVVRNPQFYFREGFCWTDVNSTYLKARIKESGIYDVLTMSLFTKTYLPDLLFVCLINSSLLSKYVDTFINSTSHFQINDARQLPIIIPNAEQLHVFEKIFNRAVEIQKNKFSGKIAEDEAEEKLTEIQKELDKFVEGMYLC
ncbi:MAG: Eco57I restriction-modification methylase domain-containing protein [Candidatus Marinimicrobia bacterium]|nr:Eco57I restriction-modification methylase domain-containing protein [Candidatus Neomarinimicrobiota bacterium]